MCFVISLTGGITFFLAQVSEYNDDEKTECLEEQLTSSAFLLLPSPIPAYELIGNCHFSFFPSSDAGFM